MTAKTKAELSTDVLRKLGILDGLATAAAEDALYVEDQYDHKHAELKDKGLAYWPNTARNVAEIPAAVFGALVDIMCDDVASAFGTKTKAEMDDYGRPCTVGTKGVRNLRIHMAKRSSGEQAKAVYF